MTQIQMLHTGGQVAVEVDDMFEGGVMLTTLSAVATLLLVFA